MNKTEASNMFKALGDEKRLKIVKKLYNGGEMCACELLELFSCAQSTLSHHLDILVKAKLIIVREAGKWCHYSANKEVIDELLNFIVTPCNCARNNSGCGCE